jgi:hypothetical protein
VLLLHLYKCSGGVLLKARLLARTREMTSR